LASGDEVNNDLAVVYALRLDVALIVYGIFLAGYSVRNDRLKLVSNETFTI
jgi:hypothetical protein